MKPMYSYLPWLIGWCLFGIGQAIPVASYLALAVKIFLLGFARVLPQAPFVPCA